MLTILGVFILNPTVAHAATEIVIDKTTQTLVCWNNETQEVYLSCPVSTGISAKSTPEGTFETSDYYTDWHKLFYNSWSYGAIRISKHILLHSTPYTSPDPNKLDLTEYAKLGTPASHGCIRMSTENIQLLTQLTAPGTKVTVFSSPKAEILPMPLDQPVVIEELPLAELPHDPNMAVPVANIPET